MPKALEALNVMAPCGLGGLKLGSSFINHGWLGGSFLNSCFEAALEG